MSVKKNRVTSEKTRTNYIGPIVVITTTKKQTFCLIILRSFFSIIVLSRVSSRWFAARRLGKGKKDRSQEGKKRGEGIAGLRERWVLGDKGTSFIPKRSCPFAAIQRTWAVDSLCAKFPGISILC